MAEDNNYVLKIRVNNESLMLIFELNKDTRVELEVLKARRRSDQKVIDYYSEITFLSRSNNSELLRKKIQVALDEARKGSDPHLHINAVKTLDFSSEVAGEKVKQFLVGLKPTGVLSRKVIQGEFYNVFQIESDVDSTGAKYYDFVFYSMKIAAGDGGRTLLVLHTSHGTLIEPRMTISTKEEAEEFLETLLKKI